MEYRKHQLESYNIHTIKSDKYKTCCIELIMRNRIDEKTYTDRVFLSDVMNLSSKKYPNNRDIDIEVENLYNVSFDINIGRNGNYVFTNYIVNFINPKYTEDSMLEETINFMFEMIFNPDISNHEFNSKTFDIAFKVREEYIKSEKERIKNHTIVELLKTMSNSSPISIASIGKLELLNKITPSSLVDSYHNFMDNDYADFMVYGDLDMNKVVSLIKDKCPIKTIKVKDLGTLDIEIPKAKKIINKEEKMRLVQSLYTEGYTLNNLTPRETDYVFPIFNAIFGNSSGSMSPKLFQVIREKNSLCYSINSIYGKHDHIMLIVTGIDSSSKDKCHKLINSCLKEMIDGKFTQEQIDNVKLSIISSFDTLDDSKSRMIDYYYYKDFYRIDDIPTRIKNFNDVTKEEIVNVAKKINLCASYFLNDGGNNNGKEN